MTRQGGKARGQAEALPLPALQSCTPAGLGSAYPVAKMHPRRTCKAVHLLREVSSAPRGCGRGTGTPDESGKHAAKRNPARG